MRISDWSSDGCSSDLFGLVLAIGLLVDDAIVVVENVERLMEENPGMTAREATIRSMQELQVALVAIGRSEEHTSELQSLMRISYAVFCLKKKNNHISRTRLKSRNNIQYINTHSKLTQLLVIHHEIIERQQI